jgi:hypothetical protein
MRQLLFAFAFAIGIGLATSGQSAQAATKDFLVPVAGYGNPDYINIRAWLDAAAGGSHNKAGYYSRMTAFGVTVESAQVDTGVPLNPTQMPFEINGYRYWIPTDLTQGDNYAHLEQRGGSKPGVYYVQQGFRRNTDSGMEERVFISIRIAGSDGAVLMDLEYHEATRPNPY